MAIKPITISEMKNNESDSVAPKRQLNWFDAVMIVSGATIGAGIFMNPSESALFLQNSSQLLFVWALGGVIAMLGALCFAELGAMYPRSGGQFHYLREAFPPVLGFLFGWTLFTTIQTGAIAAVSVTCARFIRVFIPMSETGVVATAAVIIWILTLLNIFGIRPGTNVQNVLTVLKIAGLGILIAIGLFYKPAQGFHPGPLFPEGFDWKMFSAMGLALMPVLFSYGGWQNLNFVGGEVKRPERNLPVGALGGVGIVIIVYLLASLVYAKSLPFPAIQQSTRVAADSIQVMTGTWGERFLALAIIISTLGMTNVIILTGPRVYFSMARAGSFPRFAGRIHPRFDTPYIAIILQSAWATGLLLSNTYGQLLQTVTFGDWIFYALTTLALLVLRRKRPDLPRPFRVWGYPVIPVLFFLISAAVVINVFISLPVKSLIGTAIILAGIPLYLFHRSRGGSHEV